MPGLPETGPRVAAWQREGSIGAGGHSQPLHQRRTDTMRCGAVVASSVAAVRADPRAVDVRRMLKPPRSLLAASAALSVSALTMTLGSAPAVALPLASTFTYTGGEQSYVVPAGVVQDEITANGA